MLTAGKRMFFISAAFLFMGGAISAQDVEKSPRLNEIYVVKINAPDSQGYTTVTKIERFKEGAASFEKQPSTALNEIKESPLSFFLLGQDKTVGSLRIEDVKAPNKIKINASKGAESIGSQPQQVLFLLNAASGFKGTYYKVYSDLFTIKSVDFKTNTAVIEAREDTVIEYDFTENLIQSTTSTQAAYIEKASASAINERHDAVLVAGPKGGEQNFHIIKVLPTSRINSQSNLELSIQFLPEKGRSVGVQETLLPSSWRAGSSLQDVTLFIDHYKPHHRHG